MSLRCVRFIRFLKTTNTYRHALHTTTVSVPEPEKTKAKEYRTENNIIFYEDPDKFGTLSKTHHKDMLELEDEGDIKEDKRMENSPLHSQKLTIKQYSDIIKQYLKHKRLKEALNVLEVRMLQEDRVKPENYIYNILIGACADVGYTRKAFKLFSDMKKRALKPTGDTYTCLFQACYNSPWAKDGLSKAKHLRELMIEKGIEPNLTNYNSMIKTFGRCGDLPSAFQIVDEMVSKGIKIRVHTFNHLLQACITDKENGLRHALIVWRKMLKMKEKPNIYSFNLMLKCVKDCNMGSKEDITEMLGIIQEQIALSGGKSQMIQLDYNKQYIREARDAMKELEQSPKLKTAIEVVENIPLKSDGDNKCQLTANTKISIETVEKLQSPKVIRNVPNLLSKNLQMQEVLSLREVRTVQEKFAVIGGQEDFLKEMEVYSVKPDIKTFTQMLPLLEDTREAENKLLDTIKMLNLKADISFYNMLIKKRCLRQDYDGAFEAKDLIEKENKRRIRKHPMKKKLRLQPNIMTYGVLAMACNSKEKAETLLNQMNEEKTKVNIEILGTLLRQGTANVDFGYVLYIMNLTKNEDIQVNDVYIKHLEDFYNKCKKLEEQSESVTFKNAFRIFKLSYKKWLEGINIDQVLKAEHPWAQFNYTYPETIQRQNIKIEEPRKFYKPKRKFVLYAPPV